MGMDITFLEFLEKERNAEKDDKKKKNGEDEKKIPDKKPKSEPVDIHNLEGEV